MLLNTYQVNDQQVNGDNDYVDGIILKIEKIIKLRDVAEAYPLLYIEKDIQLANDSTILLTIAKIIEDEQPTFFSRNGWEPIITVGGILLTARDLTGGISVTKSENDNTVANFSVILYPNTYSLYNYQGKDVTITIRTLSSIYRIFTGKVDVPMINIIEEKLTLNCVADRRVLLNNMADVEPYIGYYSATVLGDNADTDARINARMSTIPASLDFDSWNRYIITSWTAKASPDFSYGSSAVYRRDPEMTIDSAGQVLNSINITMNYGYQRKHARYAQYFWRHTYAPGDSGGTAGICDFLRVAPSMPTRQMITSAIQSAGWPIVPGTMSFGRQYQSGSYNCSGVWVQWSTVQTSTQNLQVYNSNGTPATDSTGNKIYRSVTAQIADNTNVFTMSAQWNACNFFSQNVTESYSLTVQAPESLSRYGLIASQESYGYDGNDAYASWEQSTAYQEPPQGVTIYTDGVSGSYFFNSTADRNTFNNAYISAINKANTSILKSHRNTRITFQRPFTPTMELSHTVQLTGKWMRGSGKCSRITHYLNISDNGGGVGGEAYTDVMLLQYRGSSTITPTPLTVTAPPIDNTVYTQFGAILQTHLGEDPDQPAAALWNGYVGNKTITQSTSGGGSNITRSNYPESFTVDTPSIPDNLRSTKTLAKSVTYNVNLPNDNVVYESYG